MISVVLPVRDGARFLAEAIDSVLAQTFRDFELLVVDDGSTDATGEIVAAAAARDGRVRCVRLSRSGLPAALNVGLREARFEWVARMDADDVMLPDRLTVQLRAASAEPDVVAWAGWAQAIGPDGRPVSTITTGPTTRAEFTRAHRAGLVDVLHPTVLLRRDAAIAVGGYDPALDYAEDVDLWDRLGEVGPILTIPRTLIRFRVHAASHTTTGLRRAIDVQRYVRERRHAARHGRPLTWDDFAAAEAAAPAWRRLARERDVRTRFAYRRAGVLAGEGRPVRAIITVLPALLANPGYVAPRLWRQVVGPRLRAGASEGGSVR